jgi:hypothetical protein
LLNHVIADEAKQSSGAWAIYAMHHCEARCDDWMRRALNRMVA